MALDLMDRGRRLRFFSNYKFRNYWEWAVRFFNGHYLLFGSCAAGLHPSGHHLIGSDENLTRSRQAYKMLCSLPFYSFRLPGRAVVYQEIE